LLTCHWPLRVLFSEYADAVNVAGEFWATDVGVAESNADWGPPTFETRIIAVFEAEMPSSQVRRHRQRLDNRWLTATHVGDTTLEMSWS